MTKYKYLELTINDQVNPKMGHHNVSKHLYLEEDVLLIENALIMHSVYRLVVLIRDVF